MTQKALNPVESPRILGPIILPSNCCKKIINNTKYKHWIGSCNNIRIADGIAPINGPKNGITLVTPTITLTKSVYGIFMRDNPMQHITPIIMESIIFPIINPPKISLLFFAICNVIFAFLTGNKA